MTAGSARYFSINTNSPLSYDICGQLISRDGFVHHRRTFGLNVFILVTEGTLHITANGTEYSLSPDHYIFLRAGEEHFGYQPSAGRLSYLWVHFNEEAALTVLDKVPVSPKGINHHPAPNCPYLFPEQGKVMSPAPILYLFRRLMSLSLEEAVSSPLMLDYTLSLLLMEISHDYFHACRQLSPKLPPVILAVCDWIHANYYHPFTVKELAAAAGYQSDYLSFLFKKHMGISLIQYTNRLRIEASKNLLSNCGVSIREAAYSCGFPDEKYFMKVFKKFENQTPSEYKNSL